MIKQYKIIVHATKEWDESKVKRDARGQFTSKSSSEVDYSMVPPELRDQIDTPEAQAQRAAREMEIADLLAVIEAENKLIEEKTNEFIKNNPNISPSELRTFRSNLTSEMRAARTQSASDTANAIVDEPVKEVKESVLETGKKKVSDLLEKIGDKLSDTFITVTKNTTKRYNNETKKWEDIPYEESIASKKKK